MSGKNLVLQLWAKMLSTNQVAVLSDHQYLWKESIDTFDFFCTEFVIKWSYHLRLLLLVECGQFCPPSCPTTKPYVQFDCRIHWLSISQERVSWCRSFSGCFLDSYPRKIASETTFFGWVWPGVLLIQSDRRILWLSMSLDGINWYLRFFTFR